jgi:hypothetical protein
MITHVFVGLLVGAAYYNTGNEASKVQGNCSCIFFCTLFLFFANSMPCVITSKCNRNNINEIKLFKKSVYTTNNNVM